MNLKSPTLVSGIVAFLSTLAGWLKVNVDPEFLNFVATWVLQLLTLVSTGIVIARSAMKAWRERGSTPAAPPSNWAQLVVIGLLMAGLLVASGGCVPDAAYVDADRATFNAVAPEYTTLVAASPDFTPEEKARRARTVAAWDLRLRNAERAIEANPLGAGAGGAQGSGAGQKPSPASAGAPSTD